jgi:hypothetical protein
VLASVCIVITAFSINRGIILGTTLLTSILTGIQYFLLNEGTTVFLIAVSLIYSALLMMENKLSFVRTHSFTVTVLSVQTIGYLLLNGLNFGWALLALAGTILGTVALWFQNPIHLKTVLLGTGLIWFAYQVVSGAYGQLPGEVVFIGGVTFSLAMLIKARKNGIPLAEVEELPTVIRKRLTNADARKEPAFS